MTSETPEHWLPIKLHMSNSAKDLGTPSYASKGSVGLDLRANVLTDIIVRPGERCLIDSGVHIDLPIGYEAQVRSRSGLALGDGMIILQGTATIDNDYSGSIKMLCYNASQQNFTVFRGLRLAQMIVSKAYHVFWDSHPPIALPARMRGNAGFGSTGKI